MNAIVPSDVRFLEPREMIRDDGRRGIAVAYVKKDLFVIPLEHGMTWAKHPGGGVIITHPWGPPLWCHFEGTTYIRTKLLGVH
jgi:hypothetical protein